jgi:hypothetical protein
LNFASEPANGPGPGWANLKGASCLAEGIACPREAMLDQRHSCNPVQSPRPVTVTSHGDQSRCNLQDRSEISVAGHGSIPYHGRGSANVARQLAPVPQGVETPALRVRALSAPPPAHDPAAGSLDVRWPRPSTGATARRHGPPPVQAQLRSAAGPEPRRGTGRRRVLMVGVISQ